MKLKTGSKGPQTLVSPLLWQRWPYWTRFPATCRASRMMAYLGRAQCCDPSTWENRVELVPIPPVRGYNYPMGQTSDTIDWSLPA